MQLGTPIDGSGSWSQNFEVLDLSKRDEKTID